MTNMWWGWSQWERGCGSMWGKNWTLEMGSIAQAAMAMDTRSIGTVKYGDLCWIHSLIHGQLKGWFSPWEFLLVRKVILNQPWFNYTKATVKPHPLIWLDSARFMQVCTHSSPMPHIQLPCLWVSLVNALFVISFEQHAFWRHTCTIRNSITYILLTTRLAYSTTSARPMVS